MELTDTVDVLVLRGIDLWHPTCNDHSLDEKEIHGSERSTANVLEQHPNLRDRGDLHDPRYRRRLPAALTGRSKVQRAIRIGLAPSGAQRHEGRYAERTGHEAHGRQAGRAFARRTAKAPGERGSAGTSWPFLSRGS